MSRISDRDEADEPIDAHASSNASAGFTCDICSSTFTRADHVARHKQSHSNQRTFSCPYCPKAFNRVDLLNRHKVIHERHTDVNGPTSKRMRRVARACQSCISAKARCDNGKPCSRCRTRRQNCIVTPTNFQDARCSWSQDPTASNDNATNTDTNAAAASTTLVIPTTPMSAPSPTNTLSERHFDNNNFSISNLIEPPVVTQSEQSDNGLFQLAGISNADNDGPVGFGPTFFQLDHTFSRDFDFDFASIELASNEFFAMTDSPGSNLQSIDGQSSASRRLHTSRFEAFKKSPWLWSPAEKDSAYAENDALNVNESGEATLLEIEQASSDYSLKVKSLTHDIRDQLLAMVIDSARMGTKRVQSFPSITILNGLFQTYFYKTRTQPDKWIHASSLEPSDCPIQLIGAVVAGGAQFVAEKAVWSMGLALFESVRLSLSRLIDSDNTWTRNLGAIQTYRLWIDFGLWSGFKRKMEISEGFEHIVVTMLRRAGAFRYSFYQDQDNLLANMSLDPGSLKANWMHWVRLESMKRLALHTLIHDAQFSIAFAKPPSVMFVEYTVPLPAPDAQWLASTPSQWAACYQPDKNLPSLLEFLQDFRMLDNLRDRVDIQLTHMVILYGFWAQVWNYQDTCKFRFGLKQKSHQAPSSLWHAGQYQELYRNLTLLRDHYTKMRDPFASELLLTAEHFLMLLQVSFLDLQQVAGKAGEKEAEHAFNHLQQEWFDTRAARCAIWHAGQVLRAAATLCPTSLRDFNAVAVYQAGLCLWVYGFIGSVEPTRQTSTEISTIGQGMEGQFQVLLDGVESAEKRNFIEYGQGIPCITTSTLSGDSMVPLTDQRSVMEAIRGILRKSFPANCSMPPLVENLCSLMEDLSDLASNNLQDRD